MPIASVLFAKPESLHRLVSGISASQYILCDNLKLYMKTKQEP